MFEPKIALVCDYLTQYGGAERTLEAIHELFPDSTVYTSSFIPENFPESFSTWNIKDAGINKLPLFNKLAKNYTFLYPFVFESFDLREYDIVISSWSAWSKAVLTNPKQLHISYCHTPPRFLYKYSGESAKRNAWYYKPFISYLDNFLRIWDYDSAQRPDYLIANSKTVQNRIKKFYKREAEIIYPPVKLSHELILTEGMHRFDTSYYLIVSRLEAYKNISLAIEAFNDLDFPLRIAGTGKEEAYLKSISKGNIAFMGKVTDRERALLLQNCNGFISPTEDEDFGIAAIEALSYGKPVLAHKSGGFTETIEDGKTGMFFEDLSPKALAEAVLNFGQNIKASMYDPAYIKESSKKYDESIFKEKFKTFVEQKWSEKQKS